MKSNITSNRVCGRISRLQIAACLLFLGLGAAGPFSASGQGVISSSSTNGADLDTLFLPPTNSVMVNSGVAIDNTGSGNDAVSGSSTNWSLANAGTLNGNNNGVNFGSGGSVSNLSGGIISGGIDGVQISGDTGSVDNAGSISGNTAGVLLNSGGSVNNQATGTISGNNAGVQISGGLGYVTNAGTISGEGVFMTGGGVVDNQAGGTISGFNFSGVEIDNAAGSVVNAGTITSANNDAVLLNDGGSVFNSGSIIAANAFFDGVNVSGGGSVTNVTGGTISGGDNGVQISGEGVVVNSGSISGGAQDGVLLNNGGSVENQSGGTITGGGNGVEISGGDGAVVNAGSIAGSSFSGVLLSGGGSVSNLATGTISGGSFSGVEIDNAPGSVDNAGVITSAGNDGVWLSAGGDVNNQTGAAIQGNLNGVEISAPGNVVNAGSISGLTADGIFLAAGGSVSNLSGGIIAGANNGVDVVGGPGFVDNAGSIAGTNGIGVNLTGGGNVNNQSTGVIQGGQHGVYVGGSGSVANAGTITGTTGDGVMIDGTGSVVNSGSISSSSTSPVNPDTGVGVYLTGGGSVSNLSGGSIVGGVGGVAISVFGGGPGVVDNAGSIIGTNYVGVYLGNGGSVNNQAGGVIQGGQNGVEITGDVGLVNNAGVIMDASGDGIYMGAGGSVTNLSGGIIGGNTNGVEIAGGPGYVENAGSITGTNNDGVLLGGGGNVNNQAGGSIMGGNNGVEVAGNGNVVNAGTIIGTSNNGVYFSSGSGNAGTVENQTGGIISGGLYGIYLNGDGNVVNAGIITGDSLDGIYIEDFNNQDWVVNQAGGIIQGGRNGIFINYAASVTNAGTIIGTNGAGVYIDGNGTIGSTVVNLNGGWIEGGQEGVLSLDGPGSVINAGTIVGDAGTAILFDNYTNSVVLQTGSVIQGSIVGGSSFDAAYLQGNGSFGGNNGYYYFTNFETLTVQGDAARWNSPASSWNLTGTNAFFTSAEVQSGLLRINGELTTPLLTVDQGWAGGSLPAILTNSAILNSDTNGLGGSGTIVGNVDNHGYFSPGNSIGTLTILGSMTNSGNYYVEVTNTGASDQIAVSGAAVINGGNVVVEPFQPTFNPQAGNAGIYAVQTSFTILTATNGVFGTYAAATIDSNNLVQSVLFPLSGSSLSYGANNVTLVLNRTPFNSVAQSFNQNSVANALDGVGVTGLSATMATLVNQFYWQTNAAQARAALNSLGGDIHATLGMLDVRQQEAFNGLIAQRTGRISAGARSGDFATGWKPIQLASADSTSSSMQQAEMDQPLDFWVQGIGAFGHLDGDGNAQGGDFSVGGLGGGLDYRFTPELLGGLGIGYSHGSADVGGPGANGTVDDYQVAGYGGYVQGPWHLDGILSYGLLHTDTKRFINVGSIHQQANGSYDGGVLTLSTEGGYAIQFDQFTLEPTLGLNYAHLSQDSFSETGAAADGNNYGLNVNSVDMDSVRSSMGVRLGAQLGAADSTQYLAELHALWEHEFADRYAVANESFVGGSGAFDVRGVELGADTLRLGGGLTVAFTQSVQGFVNYEAGLNSQINSSTISGGLSISW